MTIHVVAQGETIESISNQYNIPVDDLIEQNGITNPYDLVIGQTIVIVKPKIIYKVQKGDTLISIANMFEVDILQILRNNTDISDYGLRPGDTIIISFDTVKERAIAITGYAYPYIDMNILKRTLPFLTYLTVFNYQITSEGGLKDINDSEIIQIAKSYKVAPMMFVSDLNQNGMGDQVIANSILVDEKIQDNLIENILTMVKKKGFYGVNQYFQYLGVDNQVLVEKYIDKLSNRLQEEGYRLVITLTPKVRVERLEFTIDPINYYELSLNVNAMLFLSYEWSASYEAPSSITSVSLQRRILDYTTNQMSSEKIMSGIPIIAYDWQLPYIKGETVARSLTTNTAIELAVVQSVNIQYNNVPEAPYFFYYTEDNILHIVWFKDARSIDAITELITEYKLQGTGIWNIMQFFAQMWFIINNKFNIIKVI